MTTSPHLTLAERRVFLALVEHRFIESSELDNTGRQSLRQAISGLRKKLDPTMRIITLHGVGYELEREP